MRLRVPFVHPVALTSHALHPPMPLVARANHDAAIPKLRRAGATEVVSPDAMAGRQMARLALRPAAVDVVETLLRGADGELPREDVRIEPDSPLAGLPIGEAARLAAALLLAVQRDGRTLAPPPADLTRRPAAVIAAVGRAAQVRRLEHASQGAPA